jgi:hypothetical protein
VVDRRDQQREFHFFLADDGGKRIRLRHTYILAGGLLRWIGKANGYAAYAAFSVTDTSLGRGNHRFA